jgi:RNA polymerase sigma-70 factor (family 1)
MQMALEIDKESNFIDSDQELLSRLKEGDREAFEAIYYKYIDPLHSYALKFLKSEVDTEDILQFVFIKLWEKHDAIYIATNLKGYLFAMVKHQVMNYIRNENSAMQHNYVIVQQRGTFGDDIFEFAVKNDRMKMLNDAIGQLPQQQRIVASMRVKGFSNKEIAQKMNISIFTVNSHYREGIKTLREKLSKYILFITISLMIFK